MRRKKTNELWFTSDPHRFKPGNQGNQRAAQNEIKAIPGRLIDGVFGSDVEYFEDGRKKSLSRKELAVKQHLQKFAAT